MLEQVLQHLNNWFLVPDGIHSGEFTVQDGGITLPFLQTGQYFRVVGSVFNDGLHQYPAKDMTEETFDGAVWALAVPKAVISLADEIAAWDEKMASLAHIPVRVLVVIRIAKRPMQVAGLWDGRMFSRAA